MDSLDGDVRQAAEFKAVGAGLGLDHVVARTVAGRRPEIERVGGGIAEPLPGGVQAASLPVK